MASPHLILGDGKLPLDWDSGEMPPAIKRDFGFSFEYQGIPVKALFHENEGEARLEVEGDIGPLPYSAESPQARSSLRQVIDAANQQMKARGLTLSMGIAHGRIRFVGELSVACPASVVSVVVTVCGLLIPLKPYLLAAEIFLAPPGEAGGRGRVRPEFRRRASRVPGASRRV